MDTHLFNGGEALSRWEMSQLSNIIGRFAAAVHSYGSFRYDNLQLRGVDRLAIYSHQSR
jgi:hypothetical protein